METDSLNSKGIWLPTRRDEGCDPPTCEHHQHYTDQHILYSLQTHTEIKVK